ncbi:hypothetical protein [Oculatella sp. LEGE 06141]|uniref:hypothetical protein n=1 Tax=Oculatella sp. LEGE 06141 TaxID=1828648 RepID=UPI001882DCCB|nr:hypothetical protein [Oculatella sp. LEGE 06141]
MYSSVQNMSQSHPLFGIYQSFLRASAIRLHPELELLWQLNDDLQDAPLPPLSSIVSKLSLCNEVIETDTTRVLTMPDFHLFFQTCLKNFRGASQAKLLSIDPDPDNWNLHDFNGQMELFDFELSTQRRVEENGRACVIYFYALSVRLHEFTADLEAIQMGRLYESPFNFVSQDFKNQQEEIARQLETQFSQQDDILPQLLEEASCIICYAALAFTLEARVEAFWQHKDAPLEQLLSTFTQIHT